jgi:hypothetical protein
MFKHLNDEDLIEVYNLLLDSNEHGNEKLLKLYNEESLRVYDDVVQWLPIEIMEYMLNKCKWEMIEHFVSMIENGVL